MVSDADIVKRLGSAGPAFFGSFRRLTEIQRRAIAPILAGKNALVVSATASGKTEAVVAPLLARLREAGGDPARRIRLLVVAPTRSLVNDLAARLETPLERMGLTCGRQIGDRRDKHKQPFVLITTPESFDSMLARDAVVEQGKTVDHLLAEVRAVFIDEAHLFDGTARGDQLVWLLGRLRRLRALTAPPDRRARGELRMCAGSATVGEPDALAERLLGAGAVAAPVPGTREIDVFGPSDNAAWMPVERADTVSTMARRLEVARDANAHETVARRLWQAMSADEAKPMRKALVFVHSRELCDTLSAYLSDRLRRRRDVAVLAHHGSLERDLREEAERTFSSSRDAVMVATTTLEVGVDIGDVDFVALIGAPPGTRALLQRIGRAGRRIGRTRVLALPRNGMDVAAFASMLLSARDGLLEPQGYARRWSVFVQQAASFVAQNGLRGRRRSDLLALADDVWPESENRTADEILDALIESGYLEPGKPGRLVLGEQWADIFDDGARGMHDNFDSAAAGIPVVDSGTGEIVARVAAPSGIEKGVALSGRVWDARVMRGEILLTARQSGRLRGGFRYAARGAPTGRAYAAHVRRGLGFGDDDAPILSIDGEPLWLHFGGSAYETVLDSLLPSPRPLAGLGGIAMSGGPGEGELRRAVSSAPVLRESVKSLYESIEASVAPGRYQALLPERCRKRVCAALFDVPAFMKWAASRRIWELRPDDSRAGAVRRALAAGD